MHIFLSREVAFLVATQSKTLFLKLRLQPTNIFGRFFFPYSNKIHKSFKSGNGSFKKPILLYFQHGNLIGSSYPLLCKPFWRTSMAIWQMPKKSTLTKQRTIRIILLGKIILWLNWTAFDRQKKVLFSDSCNAALNDFSFLCVCDKNLFTTSQSIYEVEQLTSSPY